MLQFARVGRLGSELMGIKQEVDRTWFILFKGPSDYVIGIGFMEEMGQQSGGYGISQVETE